MMLGSPKAMAGLTALPRSISSIMALIGGLALFLVFASWILISNPVGIDLTRKPDLPFLSVAPTNLTHQAISLKSGGRSDSQHGEGSSSSLPESFLPSDGMQQVEPVGRSVPANGGKQGGVTGATQNTHLNFTATSPGSLASPGKAAEIDLGASSEERESSATSGNGGASNGSATSLNSTVEVESVPSAASKNGENVYSGGISDVSSSSNSTFALQFVSSPASDSSDKVDSGAPIDGLAVSPNFTTPSENSGKPDAGSCDLYKGKWFRDPAGPLYTNNSCPSITQMQNCQGNGRPDKDYESWRWKPDGCDLPRFDPKKFLELMRGKKLAFIGDSVARNQMESMLCILWQAEAPINRGNRRMQRWFFRSTSTFIIRIWSSWLVNRTSEAFQYAPEGIDKLHLDVPDETFMEFLPQFDVVVISSGHWFSKQSIYILNKEIVGWQLWKPDKPHEMKISNVEAYRISVETIVTAIAAHPNYTGLTIVRSFSPDHYEGGAWNTGGSCTGKVRPALEGELAVNGFTEKMHEMQVTSFAKAFEKAKGNSKLRLMDITRVFDYRVDGHPGPYRSPDPTKKTKRGPNGEPPPQDCLHWCMPGPVDTWNEIVLEIIHREFKAG